MKQSSHKLSLNAILWLENLLFERFGIEFKLDKNDDQIVLYRPGREEKIKFTKIIPEFYGSESPIPCCWWDPKESCEIILDGEPLPLIGLKDVPDPVISKENDTIAVNYDLFGLFYWMLTRIEELNRDKLDSYDRFPATASHAYQYDYLDRPIVDEWMVVLQCLIKRLWPDSIFIESDFKTIVSHDVDLPSAYGFKSWSYILRVMVSLLIKKKDFKASFLVPIIKFNCRKVLPKGDPVNTFDWIMDESDRYHIKSSFYFICGKTDPETDADYDLDHPAITHLLRKIHMRKHEIGLHPSFHCCENISFLSQEFFKLKSTLEREGINQKEFGNRMHYLRWSHPQTLVTLDRIGLSYDTTMGYADMPGFRCGTCHEYPAFDPVSQKALSIRIRPLIVMEGSVISEKYMGLGISKSARSKILDLKHKCRNVNGLFTLLWHNSSLRDGESKQLYTDILKG